MSWELARLADICEIKLGKTPSRSDKSYWDEEKLGSNVWVSIADLTKLSSRFIADSKEYITDKGASLFKPVKAGTLLMSFKLSIGKLAYANCDLYTNEAIVGLPIKDKNKINSDFLFYFLQFYDWDKETENDVKLKGKTLNKSKLNEIEVPLPSLSTQQKIVAKLDAIFSEINIAMGTAEANVKNAEALFQSYLTKIYDEDAKNSKVVTLGSVCKVIAGQSPESKNYNNKGEGLPFYQGKKHFGDMYINPPTIWTSEITKEAIKNDILMSVRAPVGPVNIATERICIGRGLAAIRATDKIDQAYLYSYLLKIEKELIGNVGAVFNSINKTQIENLKLALPLISKQYTTISKISFIKNNVDIVFHSQIKKIKELISLKQSILQQAFSGELVKD